MMYLYLLPFLIYVQLSWVGLCEDLVLYSEIVPANTSDSLIRIKQLPIVYYKFLFDSIPDRVQLGVIGPDAQRLFPESIDVIPSTAFAKRAVNPDGENDFMTVSVTNLPVVDKNVIFMHGIAAIKELITRYEKLHRTFYELDDIDKETKRQLEELREGLRRDASQVQQEKLKIAKQELELAEKQLEQEKLKAEQEMARVQAQLEDEKSLLELEEKLAKERLIQQSELSKIALERQLMLERELAESKEALQRKTAESVQALKASQSQELEQKRLDFEKEKIRAEIEAKAEQDRLDSELALKKMQMQAKLETERMVQGIKSVSTQINTIVQDLLSHPEQLAFIAGLIIAVIAAYYSIRELTALIRDFIQRRIGRPTLVRETSYHWSIVPDFISRIFESKSIAEHIKKLEEEFADVVLSSDDKERVINLAYATRNTRRAGAPFRHVLFHGPPGTGKTLIARRLAKCSGMDYAILSGGDVAPLGEDAVSQLHALFEWAKHSKKGLLVFIDEAEAFLSTRAYAIGDGSNDAHLRNALNALLYQTGIPSKHFMLVLATNRPEDLDSAILDRIDVSLNIGLPAELQRIDLIKLYLKIHIQNVVVASMNKGLKKLFYGNSGENGMEEDCVSNEALQFMSNVTNGFSGREISKLCISAQYAMYLAPNRTLTWDILKRVIIEKVTEHQIKETGFQTHNSQKEYVEVDSSVELTTPARKNKAEARRSSYSLRKR